jgi:tripartite motif-containing protein 71
MVGVKRLIAVGGLAAVLVGLAGCPSQFLARIKEEIAKAPFMTKGYSFLRQWGNAVPEYSFGRPVVKVDTAGYVYVADSSFRIRKFTGTGAIQKTFDLFSTMGLLAQVYDMAFDTAGNMYVTTNSNEVQKYNVSGTLVTSWGGTTLYGSGTPLALSNPSGIAVDGSGNVYVADSNRNRIVKFDSVGGYIDTWTGTGKNGTGSAFSTPQGIALDRNGNTLYVVDKYNSRIMIYSTAGDYLSTFGTYGSLASSGTIIYLYYPQGITLDSATSQNIYVTDTNNNRVQKVNASYVFQTAWGLLGTADGQFSSPQTIAVDTSGYVYVSDVPISVNEDVGRVQKFDSTGLWIASWGGKDRSGNGSVSFPGGVAIDGSGNSFIVDTMNMRIQKFDSAGAYLLKWGSLGFGNGQFDFSGPATIALDASGNVYVPDTGNDRIQVFDSSGNYIKQWGTNGNLDGNLISPTCVAIDSSGNIYVTDAGNSRIQVFDPSGYYLRKWGTAGTSDGQFQFPYGMAIDIADNVYVADLALFSPRTTYIQKFDSQGKFLASWGAHGSGDGQFIAPVGIAVDPAEHVFVCDLATRTIQKFDSSGNFILKWGGAGVGNGTFGWPVEVAVSPGGNVVVTDWTNSLIQEFEPTF